MNDKHEKVELLDVISQFSKTFNSMDESQSKLITQIQGIVDVINKINDVAKTVTKIAENTQMISINASIEAARSGVEGRSFAVIAQEIRKLADESRSTVSMIEGLTTEITDRIATSLDIAQSNSQLVTEQSKQLQEIIRISV